MVQLKKLNKPHKITLKILEKCKIKAEIVHMGKKEIKEMINKT